MLFALKHDARLRVCSEIAKLIGKEGLSQKECVMELKSLERAAGESWHAGKRYPVDVEVGSAYTISGKPELVRAYPDDFYVIPSERV